MALIKYAGRQGRPSFFDTFFDDAYMKDRFFDGIRNPGHFTPATNIIERENHFEVSMALAGFTKDSIHIEVDGDLLKIHGQRSEEKVDENEKVTLKEYQHKQFERSFTLPEVADSDKLEASFTDGMLTVHIPKRKEVNAPVKRISIK